MGRAWRIEYEGALYHLMSRGNDGQDIYLNDADRNLFLETISEMSERFKVDIFDSAVSHSVKTFKEKMINDKKVKNQFDKINSHFKL